MVIDLEKRRTERERAKLEKYANPSLASDLTWGAAIPFLVMIGALWIVVYVILQQPGK
jgi:hypothetical protein